MRGLPPPPLEPAAFIAFQRTRVLGSGVGCESDLSPRREPRDVLACSKRQRLNGHRRLSAAGGDETAAVTEKQIPDVVASVVLVDDRRPRIVPHPARAEQMHRRGL